ncbi:hypothetical protein ANN_08028 [Periplaneta americana]|uniref:Uncharacterized protein n=1 Tax=Periplaneta americana TaxID=6978 RepID=A0ABQ8T093_PERAM|nr:hypothetical protein ANN_08028 [Periplaneta americana]
MSPGSSTESYPAFAHIGLRENPEKNLNQVICPDRDSNPGHLVSRPDALTVTPQKSVAWNRNQRLTAVYTSLSIPRYDKCLNSGRRNVYHLEERTTDMIVTETLYMIRRTWIELRMMLPLRLLKSYEYIRRKLCKSNAGINIYMGKAHPEERRKKLAHRYTTEFSHSSDFNNASNISPNKNITDTTTTYQQSLQKPLETTNRNSVVVNNQDPVQVFQQSEDVISYPENTQSDHISFHPMKEWEEKLCHIQSAGTSEDFEALMDDVTHFFTQQMTELPGPQHPAVKHYQARKVSKINSKCNYKTTSNPQKKSKRQRMKNRQKYEYELTQYQFYNQRRKVARKVLHNINHKATCKISTRLITEHFEHVFNTTNNSSPLSDEDEDSIQFPEDIVITESDIHKALFGIKVDTSLDQIE